MCWYREVDATLTVQGVPYVSSGTLRLIQSSVIMISGFYMFLVGEASLPKFSPITHKNMVTYMYTFNIGGRKKRKKVSHTIVEWILDLVIICLIKNALNNFK